MGMRDSRDNVLALSLSSFSRIRLHTRRVAAFRGLWVRHPRLIDVLCLFGQVFLMCLNKSKLQSLTGHCLILIIINFDESHH